MRSRVMAATACYLHGRNRSDAGVWYPLHGLKYNRTY